MTYKVELLAALAVADATTGVIPSSPLPAGVTQGNTRFTITDSNGAVVQTQDVAGLDVVFTGIADGTFTASAQFLDSTGALLGDAVVKSFVDAVEVPPAATTFTPLATLTATATVE